MQNINVRPITVIVISIVLGFLLGIVVTGFYTRHRIEQLMQMNTSQGLKTRLLEVIDPDAGQQPYVDSLVNVFAERNSRLTQNYKDSLRQIRDELSQKLNPKLNDKQKKKIQKTRELGIKSSSTKPTPLARKKISEMREDSISSALIDDLQRRRQEVRIKAKNDARAQEMKKRLQLSEAQFVLVDSITRQYIQGIRALQKDSSLTQIQRREKLRFLRQNVHKTLKPILTEEQFNEYQNIEKEQFKERMKTN